VAQINLTSATNMTIVVATNMTIVAATAMHHRKRVTTIMTTVAAVVLITPFIAVTVFRLNIVTANMLSTIGAAIT